MKKLIKSLFKLFGLELKRLGKFSHVFRNRPINQLDDDFNWTKYNDHYREELVHISKKHTIKLNNGDYIVKDNTLLKQRDILPLHPNYRLLYETIILLNPSKILEFGCGGGDHLHNINVLAPHIATHGVDRAEAQLHFCMERYPLLKDKIQQYDITMPFSSKLPLVDITYTQAVIMHIHTGNGHLIALSNLFKLASKHVLLMENWTCQQFLNDINYLFEQEMIPWKSIYFYFRRAPELQNRPHLMVISNGKLPLEPLNDYSQLLKT